MPCHAAARGPDSLAAVDEVPDLVPRAAVVEPVAVSDPVALDAVAADCYYLSGDADY